jgi:hypothetical protein
MQSTGQTSTQALSFVWMHGSVMTKGITSSLHKKREPVNRHALAAGMNLAMHSLAPTPAVQGRKDCMPDDSTDAPDCLTETEKRANVVQLAFGGDQERFEQFLAVIREEVPDDTSVILRGSAVTGRRWRDGAPFDADGPGTSDLDLTLVGEAVIGLFTVTGFFVPGVHSRPLSADDPNIAPDLVPLRETLMAITGRPVNIQASREVVIQFRGGLMGQPYLTLIDRHAPAANGSNRAE